VITVDPAFGDITQGNTTIQRIWHGDINGKPLLWLEGPAWNSEGRYFMSQQSPDTLAGGRWPRPRLTRAVEQEQRHVVRNRSQVHPPIAGEHGNGPWGLPSIPCSATPWSNQRRQRTIALLGRRSMLEGALYLVSSFWLGAVHAATPGHGKTVSAAYLVGTRGRPADALALGIFVTLAHTSGITAFGLLATLGSATLSQRAESQVSLAMALLIVGIGVWMLASQWRSAHRTRHAHEHEHEHEDAGMHSHFGVAHAHRPDRLFATSGRPSWMLLLGLGLAGGLLPDPAALAVFLAAIASGKLVLGLLTVLVFSLGFASVLILVGMLVGRVGQSALRRIDVRWLEWLNVATASVIVLVGLTLTIGAVRQLADWR